MLLGSPAAVEAVGRVVDVHVADVDSQIDLPLERVAADACRPEHHSAAVPMHGRLDVDKATQDQAASMERASTQEAADNGAQTMEEVDERRSAAA